MVTKNIPAAAIPKLSDALSKLYWYKNDLKTFLVGSMGDSRILNDVDWNDTKREIAISIVVKLQQHSSSRECLMTLMQDVYLFNDFSHFDRLPPKDAKKWKDVAIAAVSAFKNQTKKFFEVDEDTYRQKIAKQEKFKEETSKRELYNSNLNELKTKFLEISMMANVQKRGYQFETFLNTFFHFFDLSPRSSYKIQGEQIDGSFNIANQDYLLEAKWQAEPVSRADIDAFESKIRRKLKTTLGLMISINGFTEISDSLGNGASLILMDGQDLMQILDNRISLPQVIQEKKRRAAETGQILYRIL